MSDLEKNFKLAVKYIQNLPKDAPYKASQNELLEFYALFKQSTEGQNKTKKPSRLNIVAKAKWDAWSKLGTLSKEKAMKEYIEKVVSISNKIPGKQSETFRTQISGGAKL